MSLTKDIVFINVTHVHNFRGDRHVGTTTKISYSRTSYGSRIFKKKLYDVGALTTDQAEVWVDRYEFYLDRSPLRKLLRALHII